MAAPCRRRPAVARGMNKGNSSFVARSARFSSVRGRILIYYETSSPTLRSPITFRPPRSIPFSSTKPANCTRDHRIDKFPSIDRQLAKVFYHPTPCIAPIQPPFRRNPAKHQYFPQDPCRTVALHDAPSSDRTRTVTDSATDSDRDRESVTAGPGPGAACRALSEFSVSAESAWLGM